MTKRKRPENPENLSDAELIAKVAADNDERTRRLIESAGGLYMPTAAKHDLMRMTVYLEHLLTERGLLADAMLDYEAWRSELIDTNERQIAKAKLMRGVGAEIPPGLGGPARIVGPDGR